MDPIISSIFLTPSELKISYNYSEIYYTSIDFQNQLDNFSKNLNKSRIIDWHNKLRSIEYHIKTSDNPRLWLEIHLTSLLEKKDNENRVNTRELSNTKK